MKNTRDTSISIGRRFAVIVYEAFLVLALIFLTALIALFIARCSSFNPLATTQVAILLTLTAYFTWSWSSGRRTLAMKTWKVHLYTTHGSIVRPQQALLRWLALATPWILAELLRIAIETTSHTTSSPFTHYAWALTAFIFPWLWGIFFHPNQLPFHDAISNTQLIYSSD